MERERERKNSVTWVPAGGLACFPRVARIRAMHMRVFPVPYCVCLFEKIEERIGRHGGKGRQGNKGKGLTIFSQRIPPGDRTIIRGEKRMRLEAW